MTVRPHSFLSRITGTVSAGFGRLQSIPHENPDITPESWCRHQPCLRVTFGARDLILTQPTSTVLVYFLGIQTTAAGLYLLAVQEDAVSRLWWGVSLILWGIGALLAGTSYQAFGYEIKCRGRDFCSWTSWWEVVYLMFQQVSMAAMLIGVAYACTDGNLRMMLCVYAGISSIIYMVVVVAGALIPVKSLITFNVMVWYSSPILLWFIGINGWRYCVTHDPADLRYLVTWVLLLVVSAAYRLYDHSRMTERLWEGERKIWFSQNDLLHLLLIFWICYIFFVVVDGIRDYGA